MVRRIFPVAAVFCATAVFWASSALALDLPPRKPGLWEMKIAFEGRSMPAMSSQHCVDAETDKMMNAMGGNMAKDMCPKQDVQRTGNTLVVDSVCTIGGSTNTSHAVMTGDFNSAYSVKVTSKREGGGHMSPMAGADGTTTMTVDAKWLGPCAADQKPGDIVMSNGMKMNIRDIPTGPAAPGRPPQR